MSVLKIGDGVLLENDMVFQVMEVIDYKGESYLYAIESPDDMADMANPKKLNYAFLKESVDAETDEVFVEQVKDAELVKVLTKEVLEELG